MHFKGVLLSEDGSKRIDVAKTEKLGNHQDMAQYCADFVIERGGKRLMDTIKNSAKKTNICSTKALTEDQRLLFNEKVSAESTDFIKISLNRIPPRILSKPMGNVIITSKNAVESLTTNYSATELQFKNIYCVGRRTKRLIERKIGKVTHTEKNAESLAKYLIEFIEGTETTYFCSDLRLDTLPNTLKENQIKVNEIEAYQTKYDGLKIDDSVEGVMFYSPSTVESFIQKNNRDVIAFCIGETTAKEARKHFSDVRVARVPTVESVIELVNAHYV